MKKYKRNTKGIINNFLFIKIFKLLLNRINKELIKQMITITLGKGAIQLNGLAQRNIANPILL